VVDACQAPVKQACLLFGERLKALRRGGVAVDAIPDARWCELFVQAARCPVLWEAWAPLVRAIAAAPHTAVAAVVESLHLGEQPRQWREHVAASVAGARPRLYAPGDDRLFRFSMGLAMGELRGKVPAREVADAVRTEIAAR
jgi:Glu-tRNA(Gln) amidotransferase subunit E-like FAD-binding protein